MTAHIIIYCHGFGVRKDDRGLFSDIAKVLPDVEHVMFDMNEFDDQSNTLVARPLNEQAAILRQKIKSVQQNNPGAIIDLVAHSQGCVVASLARPEGVSRTIFLAPPAQTLGLDRQTMHTIRPNSITEQDGTIRMPRRDGSTTIIKEDYWKSCQGIMPLELYNSFAKVTDLSIITATKDEVLASTDFSGLTDGIKLIEQEANHDFTGEYRQSLLEQVERVINHE